MRRTLWLWILSLTLLVVIPGVVAARSEAAGETVLSRTLIGHKALRLGDRGPAVAALQRLLQARGFDPVKLDGIYGSLTERAVREAQAALGLTRDGLAGVLTVSALEARPAGASAAAAPAATPAARPAVVKADIFHAAGEGAREPSAKLVLHDAPAPVPALFALTFNGAPDPALLPSLLETLRRHDMKATFFVTGTYAEARPGLLAAIAAEGHEIGLNGWTQEPMTGLTDRQIRLQLTRAQRAVKAAVGREATWFRPPRGMGTDLLTSAAADLGMTATLWTNVAVTDHPDLSPAEMADLLQQVAHAGSVVMVHADRPTTVAAMEPFLKGLAGRGVRSTGMSDLRLP